MRPRPIRTAAAAAAIAATLAVGGCASSAGSGAADHVTTLNFFQFKGEALEDFAEIIAEFEADNPDIRVVQNQVADSETLIRTLLVKGRTPDVITLNANGSFGKLAEAGVFYDFSREKVLKTINPAVQEIIAELGHAEGEVNGLGYVNNANGVIYNRAIFAEQGLVPPTTWDEFIRLCETLKARGITPFYGTLGDSWTAMPSWNAIGAYDAQDGFFDALRAGGGRAGGADASTDSSVSFEKDFPDTMTKQAQLYSYMQDGYRGATYDDGNAAFAHGEAAMLLQGIWALSPIKAINPDIDAAIFPYPVPKNPDERMLVSGVDVVVTMGEHPAHEKEAMRFIDFLFSKGVIERFAASQNMIPAVTGATLSDDPALQSVKPYFDAGRITGFIDHQVPASIPLTGIVQQALFDGNANAALRTLDSEWAKVAARTIPVTKEGQ